MGPRFRVSSERLEKPGIEPTAHCLEGEQLNHYSTEAFVKRPTGELKEYLLMPTSSTIFKDILLPNRLVNQN